MTEFPLQRAPGNGGAKKLSYKDHGKVYYLGAIVKNPGWEHAATRAYIADMKARAAAALKDKDAAEHDRLHERLADSSCSYHKYAKEDIPPDLRSAKAESLPAPGKLSGTCSYSHAAP